MSDTVDLGRLTLQSAVSLLQSGELSSVHLVQHFLVRSRSQPQLCAFATIASEADVLQQARQADERLALARSSGIAGRLLEGVPAIIKENIHVRGLPNCAGTPSLLDFVPASDAPVVEALREAGAIVYATTHMHELAWGVSGVNPLATHAGSIGVRNAYSVQHVAGGSSSGNGAALGAQLALAALGTDTGGSVRIPAAANGVCGLRPTYGRYSQLAITPCSLNRDTPGPMARTVADLELLDRACSGDPPVQQLTTLVGVRLGVLIPLMTELDADTRTVMQAALKQLQACGLELVDIEAPSLLPLVQTVAMPSTLYKACEDLAAYLAQHRTSLTVEQVIAQVSSEDVRRLWQDIILPGTLPLPDGTIVALDAAGQQADKEDRPALTRLYLSLITQHDVTGLIFPTLPCVAVLSEPAASDFSTFTRLTRQTAAGSLTGCPGITLPIGLGPTSQLPVGLAVDALPGTDRQLLALGMALETIFPQLEPPAWLSVQQIGQ